VTRPRPIRPRGVGPRPGTPKSIRTEGAALIKRLRAKEAKREIVVAPEVAEKVYRDVRDWEQQDGETPTYIRVDQRRMGEGVEFCGPWTKRQIRRASAWIGLVT